MEENRKLENGNAEAAEGAEPTPEQAARDKLEALIKEGQRKGSLSAKELAVLDTLNLDPEQIDRFYERLERLGVETTDEEALELFGDMDVSLEELENN